MSGLGWSQHTSLHAVSRSANSGFSGQQEDRSDEQAAFHVVTLAR